MKEFIAGDELGVRCAKHVESDDDKRAKMLKVQLSAKANVSKRGFYGKPHIRIYRTVVIWLRSACCFWRKLERDNDFKTEYVHVMAEYRRKEYARKLREDELRMESSRTWYLPHFAVYNPNKPGKLRLVFDAAAKVNDCSLNSANERP